MATAYRQEGARTSKKMKLSLAASGPALLLLLFSGGQGPTGSSPIVASASSAAPHPALDERGADAGALYVDYVDDDMIREHARFEAGGRGKGGKEDDAAAVPAAAIELLPAYDDENGHRRRLQHQHEMYMPLQCNAAVESEECMTNAVPLSSLVDEAAMAAEMDTSGGMMHHRHPVVVPCGTCAYVDYTSGENVHLPHGLDVVGRLRFSSDADVVLNTTSVFVQGVLEMEEPAVGKEVKITLFGTENQTLYPHEHCCVGDHGEGGMSHRLLRASSGVSAEGDGDGDASFPRGEDNLHRRRLCDLDCPHKQNLGKKPIAVAGGKVDIRAVDPACPSWTKLKNVVKIPEPQPAECSSPSGALEGDGTFDSPDTPIGDSFFANSNSATGQLVVSDGVLKHTNRDKAVEGIGVRLNPNCLKNALYRVKFKYHVYGNTQTTIKLVLWWLPKGKTTWKSSQFHTCSSKPGNKLVECTDTHKITTEQANSEKITMHLTFKNGMSHDVDWDDISFLPEDEPSQVTKSFVVDQAFASCVRPGDDLLVTSDTKQYDLSNVREVNSVDAELGTVTMDGYFTREFATESGPGEPEFAAEVANLRRGVVFEGQKDDPDNLHGAHFIIYHTPTVVQTISGVKFLNFGQAGTLGRYPIHFHMSNDSPSLVSKNVIMDSNQRCVVIHGTNKVTVDDNVAFRTRGHCYALETGSETHNTFSRNLGAVTKTLTRINGQSDSTFPTNTAHQNLASTFWVRNAQNSFIGNVAAGSMKLGWWFDMTDSSKYSSLIVFKDNVAHSNTQGWNTYPKKGWMPSSTSVLENFRVYKNSFDGMKFFVSGGFTVKNSIIADNEFGIRSLGNKPMTFENTQIIGRSQDAKLRLGLSCSGNSGIIYSYNLGQAFTLQGVTFSGFNCQGKPLNPYYDDRFGGKPVTEYRVAAIDTAVTSGNKISLHCSQTADSWNLFIEDNSGTLGPADKGPGFIVQNNERMQGFTWGQCSQMSQSTCSAFCEGVCLRQFDIKPEGWQDGNYHKLILSNGVKEVSFDTQSGSGKHFNVVLPNGVYFGRFEDSNGNELVPLSVEVEALKAPLCENYITPLSITFATNPPTSFPTVSPTISAAPSVYKRIAQFLNYASSKYLYSNSNQALGARLDEEPLSHTQWQLEEVPCPGTTYKPLDTCFHLLGGGSWDRRLYAKGNPYEWKNGVGVTDQTDVWANQYWHLQTATCETGVNTPCVKIINARNGRVMYSEVGGNFGATPAKNNPTCDGEKCKWYMLE